jgi:O-antigen/teichoic acid export membrane protein
LAFLSFYSEDIVLVVFGEGWQTTATLVALLGMVGILKALGNPGGSIILALGYANIGFWWNLFWVSIVALTLFITLSIEPKVEIVPLVLLGLSLSVGFIWHYIIAYFAKIQYLKIIIHFTKTILICFVISWFSKEILSLLEITNAFSRLLIAGFVCVLLYLPYLYLTEKETISLIRKG